MAGGKRGPGRSQLSRSVPPPPIHATNVLHGPGNSATTAIRHRGGSGSSGSSMSHATLIPIQKIDHPPFPPIPANNDLAFEFAVVMYLLTALCMQYMNIYKTIWWLPVYPTSYSMNFYLIDPYLFFFIVIILSRRLFWGFIREGYKTASKITFTYCLVISLKATLIISLSGFTLICVWKMIQNNSPLNLLFLAYPLVSYLLLYGLTIDIPTSIMQGHSKQKQSETTFNPQIQNIPWNGCPSWSPRHRCSEAPHEIRYEADVLKVDFNSRMKTVLFNSMVCAYYVGFVPICFLQPHMYLDLWWSCLLIAFVWINSFVMFGTHFLPPRYCDTLHRCSLHLGRWQKVDHGYNSPQHVWSDSTVWPQGVLVRYQRGLYKASGVQNVAFPSDSSYARFHFMFNQPMRLLNLFLFLEVGVVFMQLYVLMTNTHWNYVVSICLMLFCNYYSLFKILRDRFILEKTYNFDAESTE